MDSTLSGSPPSSVFFFFIVPWKSSAFFRALKSIVLAFRTLVVWIVLLFRYGTMRIQSHTPRLPLDTDPASSSTLLEEVKETPIGPEDLLPALEGSGQSWVRKRWQWKRQARVLDVETRRSLAKRVNLKYISHSPSSSIFLFTNSRGQILFTRSWKPSTDTEMKGILVLLHGLNEHSGRYSHFASRLNSCGYGVYAMDWIGHGGSDGLHGFVASLDNVVKDTRDFICKVTEENPGMPCFLFGHSTGGSIALKSALHSSMEKVLEGLILTSPALRVRPSHPLVGVIAPLFSLLLPTLQFNGANKRGVPVSRDPAALIEKYTDPLVYTGPIRVRTGSEILRITAFLQRNMSKITVPFLVLHGTSDTITDPSASQDLYNLAASKHKRIKLYPGFLHDLLFEPEREEITSDIIGWMDERLKQQ